MLGKMVFDDGQQLVVELANLIVFVDRDAVLFLWTAGVAHGNVSGKSGFAAKQPKK